MEGVDFANEQMEQQIEFTATHFRLAGEKNEQQKICEIVTVCS